MSARWTHIAGALALIVMAACRLDARDDAVGEKNPARFGLGRTPTAAEIAAVDIDVSPSGAGLPAGSGTPEEGAKIFASTCSPCHGANGEGKPPAYPQLVGGPRGNIDFSSDAKTPRTIGNYWPYATTVFGYIRRAMPLTAPGSLAPDQIYAVTAYLLSREGIVPAGTRLDAKSLAAIQMPARPHFVLDDRRGSTGGKNVR